MPIVLQTAGAREDLLNIGRHIASQSQNLDVAIKFLDKIEEKLSLYASQPQMGTFRSDLGKNVYSFAVDSYVVF